MVNEQGNQPRDHTFPAFARLFSKEQLNEIEVAQLPNGRRHPIWLPLFGEGRSLHRGHYRLEQSVILITEHSGGSEWLKRKVPSLMDLESVNNSTAAMAEIRAFGGLIEAGFDVEPLQETDENTPDFVAKDGSQDTAVEVAAKHQDKRMDDLEKCIHDARQGKRPMPDGVEHSVHHGHRGRIDMTVWCHQPAGAPDPSKPNDSVQTNLISRVCSIKGDEHQISEDKSAILIVDFNDFGGPLAPHTMIDQTEPLIAGNYGYVTGALWYAFYGWKGAPVFENDRKLTMEHEGRFRMDGSSKSKFSATLLVMPEYVVCFEHLSASLPLADSTRLHITKYPRLDLKHSVFDWTPGTVASQIELDQRMISLFEANYSDLRWK